MLAALDKVEALDKHTVKFTLKEPYAWFLDILANPHAVCIVAKECVEKFGDLKKPEATVGTGPWMFDSYRPNVGFTLVRSPSYFVAGLPYIDRLEVFVDEDNASRMAAFIAGKYDLGWEFPGQINRVDWVQIKDTLKQRRPNLKTFDHPANVMTHLYFRNDKAPFNDVRVRRALSMAIDRKGIIDAVAEGVGVLIYEAQRHIAKQQYYVQLWSGVYVAVWDGALNNYGPNLGYDYGGRLMAAWLDR